LFHRYANFADGVGGASGGISAITIFYPLNIIRTKLQCFDNAKEEKGMADVVREIFADQGIAGFYQGWWGQICALGTSNFIYFYCYKMLKVLVELNSKQTIGPFMNLAVGAIAGVVNVLTTTPLWMVSTQLAVQSRGVKAGVVPYKGMIDGLTRCYNEEGLSGLWKGVGPNLMLVSNPTIHFFVYDRVRLMWDQIAKSRGTPLTSFEFFIMGAIAKAAATFATYPIQVAQSQLRNDRKNADGERKYSGTFDCLAKLYATAGYAAWFRGMGAKLWQTVLTAAFQFMTFEKIRMVVIQTLVPGGGHK
jgi:adenine nucleotide transporter 17